MAKKTQGKIVVAITGATGTIFGVRMLEILREADIETHLILSTWGLRTLIHETDYSLKQVQQLAGNFYDAKDMGAAVSSGSFVTEGMIVVPCSMRTLAAVATGYGDNLVHRAAEVTLKERRRLVLAVRETPLTPVHLENMLKLSRIGVSICPLVPSFYNRPSSIDDLVSYTVMRLLDQLDIHVDLQARWDGAMRSADAARSDK